MTYKCSYCSCTFSSTYALKRHISDKHQYIDEDEEVTFQSNMPHEEPDLWDDDDKEVSKVPYHEESESDEEIGEFNNNDESDKKSGGFDDDDNKDNKVDLTYSLSIDAEDFCETTLDDVIRDKTHPPNTKWLNDIYREFMEIVMEYQLSNFCGDRIIKLINKSRQEAEKNLLPINTKEVILTDMAEVEAFIAIYLPSTSKRSCYYCLINNEVLNNMALFHINLQTPEKMKLAISENQVSKFSIHKEFNYFWDFNNFNIYEATASDRMHLPDLGITKYLIKFTHELLH
ncbi:hypothetical protein RclHR1_09120005 [Rhizophagus clarus]|uniref:C2H2-type domain-containing protein n=1 Tax=Rhizophagus clarus TaxID=94130 RepID=A0A2Z6S317_9GLOM|nr:hypothetical protein RclHR1_09120005 [Rhizophagus clarus]